MSIRNFLPIIKGSILLIVLVVSFVHSRNAVINYKTRFDTANIDHERIKTSKIIGKYQNPDHVIFANLPYSPVLTYLTKHFVHNVKKTDPEKIKLILSTSRNNTAQYFEVIDSKIQYMQTISLKEDSLYFSAPMHFTEL
mgnify:CR=1 FL=1